MKIQEFQIENLEETLKEFSIEKILAASKTFLRSSTQFKENTDVGLIANGWVRKKMSYFFVTLIIKKPF